MRIAVRHQLIRALRCGIQADRVVSRAGLPERLQSVQAVDRTGRRVHQVADRMRPDRFQDAQEPANVAGHVRPRVGQRIPDPRLRGQVIDQLELLVREQGQHALRVHQVHPLEPQARLVRLDHPGVRAARFGRVDPELAQAIELQPHVVMGVEVVDADHLVPLIDQPPGDVVADEAGRAGHQDLHDPSIVPAEELRQGSARRRAGRVDGTGRSGHLRNAMMIRRTAYSRSGLVGNPSDIFGGKVISLLFDAFRAQATVYESPRLTVMPSARDRTTFDDAEALLRYRGRFGYYGGIRLIEALIVRLHRYCRDRGIDLPRRNFTVEYSSDIPFGVGLGGSSAIITAAFLALMDFYDLTDADIPKPEQPTIVLETETEELGITAGPQDRVIAVYGGVVVMDFSEEARARHGGRHGDYRPLPPELLPPLFVAWDERLSKSSGTVHNAMRYRAAIEHDPAVIEAMARKAALVDEAVAALGAGRRDRLGPIMDRDFDLRRSVYDLPADQVRMIDIARRHGSHAKFAGSGGAAIGICEDDAHLARITAAYAEAGISVVPVRVAKHPTSLDDPTRMKPDAGQSLPHGTI